MMIGVPVLVYDRIGQVQSLLLKVKRGEGVFYASLKRALQQARSFQVPVPHFVRPLVRNLYFQHFLIWQFGRWILNVFYRGPLFKARCNQVGRNLLLTLMPDAQCHTQIIIGDDVKLLGKLGIQSSRAAERPTLIIKDRVSLGHMVQIVVNSEVVIGADVLVAGNVRIVDNDGHPLDPAARAAGQPTNDARPIKIGNNAWIGHSATILKGVSIGEGAVVAAGSVVGGDVQPYTLVAGNPARAIKQLQRPSLDLNAGPSGT